MVAFLWCSLPVHALSQETNAKGARYTYDENDRVVAMSYYGSSGLRQSAPENVTHVESVEIVYGTTLTAVDVSFLSSLASVEELSMGGNLSDEYVEIEGSLAALAKLERLEYVFLCKRDMRDDDLEFVAKLPRIQYLEFLGGPNPWDEKGSVVTDACAESIRRAKSLRDLCIYGGNKLSDRFVSVICRDLKNLEHLDVDSGLLTDRSLHVLAEQCRNLRWLDLRSNHFTDKGVGYLASTKKLEMLWLESTSLTHDCVKSVSGLTSLRHLELTIPTITDDGVKILANLPALEILALRKPPLSDEQFAMLANHPTLESAFLNGRDLSKTKVIETIKTIPNLDHLSVGKNKAVQLAVNRFLANRKSAAGSNEPEKGG